MTLGKQHRNRAASDSRAASHKALLAAQRLFEKDEISASATMALELVSERPDHLGALELLAKCHWRLGLFAEATATLDHLTKLNPYEPGYWYLRGVIAQGQGNLRDAAALFERCASCDSPKVAEQAKTALVELHHYQAGLIEQLLTEDRVFRIAYAQNPAKACEKRGLISAAKPLDAQVVRAVRKVVRLSHRPS